MVAQADWFKDWFNSPYYHQLYFESRNKEAEDFIDTILRKLQPPTGSFMLDIGCGRGSHSEHLSSKGYDVTGIDLSFESIEYARKSETDTLHFFQHDMRAPFRINYFDAVVNFFTSFGYFERERDHLLSLKNIARNLKPGGRLLLDYFNAEWVRTHLIAADVQTIDGIEFRLHRAIEGTHVMKRVEFEHEGRPYSFTERVRLFSLPDFQVMFTEAGLWLKQLYGGYDLSEFDLQSSKRLILIAEKG